ncbi:MAG: malonate decarboxylase subunit alpha [Anaerolineales bacterium]|jgi:glutaconate CoA-transferase subunit A
MNDKWDKRKTLTEALDLVPGSDFSLAFGGVTLYRRPMAFSLALLQRYQQTGKPSNITLTCITAGLESDILIQSGAVQAIRTCYAGLEVFGLAPHFTNAIAQGELTMIEETEASFAYGLRAALAGVGFMPSTAWQGTDLLKLRPDVQSIEDPYSGEKLTAFPAIKPDVAIIHALKADPGGNSIIGINQGVDRELVLAADTVIVTCEKVVDKLDKADIIGPVVDVVVEAPNGAWPTSCHPHYTLDGEAILEFTEKSFGDDYAQLIRSWSSHHKLDQPQR